MNKNSKSRLSAALLIILALPVSLFAEESKNNHSQQYARPGWSTFIRGGAVLQFDTDMNQGGSYDSTRLALQAGYGYSWNRRTGVSLTLGYNYDGYNFTGTTGFSGLEPWEDINTFSVSIPIRWGGGSQWSAYLIPTIRSTGEMGASFEESITGGGFTGFSYRFGDHLTIGPGVGVISQIEENATIFPILIVNWQITDHVSLETGGGLGATLGPGLVLNYRPDKKWTFGFGGRYEKLRFRLDKDGDISSGVGEDASFPLFVNCTYNFDTSTSISFIGGIETGGDLRLENQHGKLLAEDSYDTGGFVGFTFNLRH